MTDVATQPAGTSQSGYRKPEPFLTRRTLFVLLAAVLVTLLFVREYRREQGPCRVQFHAVKDEQPHLVRVQDDDNPGDAGPSADPCNSRRMFKFSLEHAYAALGLALWGVTVFCAVQDVAIFRKDRRRRRRRRRTGSDAQGEAQKVNGGEVR